ncbi:MAG TPA: type II toxin-antitoxin system VapC family toxin [Stellaceae bacterium]|nr:type II toxin-antitoxin system VapC family toxin [Stellaceae bacterium]
MSILVIDASIAVKWVVEEEGTPQALALRQQAKLIAPELLGAECANILWKKVQRDELSKEEALLAARLLQAAEIELLPTRSLLEAATRIAIELDHPAYDCFYLALAVENDCRFVTADQRFLRKIGEGHRSRFRDKVIALAEAAGGPDDPTPKGRRSRSSESDER